MQKSLQNWYFQTAIIHFQIVLYTFFLKCSVEWGLLSHHFKKKVYQTISDNLGLFPCHQVSLKLTNEN